MTYQWKIPVVPVDAQVAGEEFERLYKQNGRLEPKDVVEASREETAPLHACFEWNDAIAAERYRTTQAGDMIRYIVRVEKNEKNEPKEVRAFVHVERGYHPIGVVVKTPSMCEELLMSAEREMDAFTRKYSDLKQLKPVLSAINNYKAERSAANDRTRPQA